jgi:hypothetical protein
MRNLKLLRVEIGRIDYALIALLILGGLGGYDGFPKFLTAAQANIDPIVPWILFFLGFSFLTLLKVTSRAHFSWVASLVAALSILLILMGVILAIFLSLRGVAILQTPLPLALIVASATTFLLMAVQDWFKPSVDLYSIEKERGEISGLVEQFQSGNITDGPRLRLQHLVGSLPTKIDDALNTGVLTPAEVTSLTDLKSQIRNLEGALTGPVQNWPDALSVLNTSRIKTELSL